MPPATDTDVDTVLRDTSAATVRPVAHDRVIRDDIQLLRGIAVLSVLFYHADKLLLAGGYLGVDVFFVISGYLITRNIYLDIEHGRFSYATFIARRFRRLLPACYAMLAFSAVLAAVFLTRHDMVEFLKQMLGTLSFSSNIVLWRQSGYFDTSSAFKLLLHTWSLSLEEQYYLFLPPILYLGARSGTLKVLAVLFGVSLLACFALMPFKPSAAFYLLPFRAWELLAGSICAVLMLRARAPAVSTAMKIAALSVLLLTLVFPPVTMHPGPAAVLVVLATAVLMIGALNFGRSPLARGMYFIGDISYSLYLLHWPVFAVANHVYADAVPMPVKGVLMLSVVALSYLSFRLVEQPFRVASSASRRTVFSWAAGVGALVMLAALTFHVARGPLPDGPGSRSADNAPNYGLSALCNSDSRFLASPECQSSASPSVLLWGDSYAMHLADALGQQQGFGFVQATKSQCGPVPGVAPVMGVYNEAWAQNCLSFNDSVLSYLDAHTELRVVILGSKWRQYFNDEGQDGFMVPSDADAPSVVVKTLDRSVVDTSVRALVTRITASGRKVLIVEPPPSANFDIYQCAQRKLEGLLYFGPSANCQIDQVAATLRDAGLSALLRTLKPLAGVQSYSFNTLLCDGKSCRTELDNTTLYRDEGHFSPQGSRVIGSQSSLNASISALLATATGKP